MAELKKPSSHHCWFLSSFGLLAFSSPLGAPKAATAAQTGIAELSDSRSWYLVTIDLRHQKSSPNRRFLLEKSLLYMCSVAAILLLQHNLNLVPVLLALKCTDLCSYSSGSTNLRRTTFRHMAFSNSHQTNKCQTICPSRRFVRPLVWKRPMTKKQTTTTKKIPRKKPPTSPE